MSCEHWRERIIDSLAHELTDEDEALLKEHIARCPSCARETALVDGLFRAAGPGPEWRENPATRARLLAALRGRRGGMLARVRDFRSALGWALSRPVPAYAAILLVALGIFFGLSVRPRLDSRAARPSATPTTIGEPSGEARRPLGERRFEVTGADAVLTREDLPRDSL